MCVAFYQVVTIDTRPGSKKRRKTKVYLLITDKWLRTAIFILVFCLKGVGEKVLVQFLLKY